MSETISMTRVIPARAERIFNAWLNPDEHAAMTRSGASGGPDGSFTAWDGYISGKTVAAEPHARIVQQWRTTQFPTGAEDSTLTVTFDEVEGGTRLTLVHENLPDGQGAEYEKGWSDFYFKPMNEYFTSAPSRLHELGEIIEGAVQKTEKAAVAAVNTARTRARKGAIKAVKKVQKQAKAVGARVKKLLAKKAKKAPVKKAAAKAGRATVVAKKVAKKASKPKRTAKGRARAR